MRLWWLEDLAAPLSPVPLLSSSDVTTNTCVSSVFRPVYGFSQNWVRGRETQTEIFVMASELQMTLQINVFFN